MTTKTLLPGLTALLVLHGCRAQPGQEAESARFIATTPIVIDTSYERAYVAEIRSVRNIEVRAQEKGYLDQMPVDEGRDVQAGQLLFRIMPQVYEAEVQKAAAEVRASEIELDNATQLVAKNVVSPNEQAMAQAKLDRARGAGPGQAAPLLHRDPGAVRRGARPVAQEAREPDRGGGAAHHALR